MMNKHKKGFAMVLAACLLTFSLFGCTKEKDTEDPTVEPANPSTDTADTTEQEPEDHGGMVGMANPMTEVTAEELAAETGVSLAAPEGASDVKFFTVKGGSVTTAEMDFTLSGRSYTYRATPTAELEAQDTTGLYYEWIETKEVTVGSCTAVLNLGGEASGMYWLDIAPGLNYSLSCKGETTEAEMLAAAAMLFAPVQGDASGMNYSGMYMNGSAEAGCDLVAMNQKADGSYDAQLSIYRLAGFSGTGIASGDQVEMTLIDPNDGEMKAVFYPEADGTYSVKITDSTWTLLPADTVFTGFTVSE